MSYSSPPSPRRLHVSCVGTRGSERSDEKGREYVQRRTNPICRHRPLLSLFPIRHQDVDDVFAKYDPKGTGSLDVHSFVLNIISPPAEPEPWFRDRATYEFHVLNRAPMKKVAAGCPTTRL